MTGNYPSIHIGMSQKIKSYLCRRRATKVIKFAKFTMTNCNALSYVSRLLKENRGPQHILCCVKSGGVRRLILQLPEFTVNFFFFFFFFFFAVYLRRIRGCSAVQCPMAIERKKGDTKRLM